MKVNMQRLNSRLSFQMKFFSKSEKHVIQRESTCRDWLRDTKAGEWLKTSNGSVFHPAGVASEIALAGDVHWCQRIPHWTIMIFKYPSLFFLSRNISFTQHYHSTKKHIENLFISFLHGFNKPSGELPTEGIRFPGTWWYTVHTSHKRLAGFSTAFDQRSNRNKAWRVVSWTRLRKLARLTAHI